METQRQEFRIGIMVLTAIACLTLMTVFFGRQPMIRFGDDNVILVRFQRSPGIKRNSPVFKNGIQIGRVTKAELVDQDREVEVTISLDKNKKVYTDEECRIRQTVIMGEASLEFVKVLNFTGKIEEIDPAVPLVGVGSTDLMSGFGNIEGDLNKIIKNVADSSGQLGVFVERLNAAIGTPEEFQVKFGNIVNETRQTMVSMRQTTDGISRLVNDPEVQRNVRKVIGDLPDIIERSRVLVGESTLFVQETRTLVEKGNVSLDNLTAGLEKITRTLEVITKIADQIDGDVPEIVSAVKRSAVRLESLFSEMTMIVENFRNADGTVKRLIRDPEAYNKLLTTLDNVERITDEVDWMLRADVKPITHNVKILTDKVARDPAIFIRNLLRKEPPTKPFPCLVHRGDAMFEMPYYPAATVIDGEVVEVLEEIPVPVHQARLSQKLPTQNWKAAQQIRKANPIHDVTAMPVPSEGRIVNVDPRYPEF